MALWFLDSTNGDDANDGKGSVATSFGVKTLSYIGGIYTIVDATVAGQVATGDVIYITSATVPAQAAWWEVVDELGDIVTLELFSGTWVESSRTDAVSASGPVETMAQLLTLIASGDRAYSVVRQGELVQIYPEPISELVALALKETLETITLTNGYAFDIGTVIRPTSLTVPILADKQVVMRQPADRIADAAAAMFEHHKQEFELFLMIRVGETDTVALDTYANRFHAAVRKALTADVTLGGACIDLAVGDLEMVDSDDAIATYALDVTATYRHEDDDPYPAA